ncbi:exodeoxyribonuclease III [Commensalibacter oyaizuii]|uniref:Exodeoxyribonuclease III n=1 Tax=Commensalibacter oyaizuii TaxID=3043873 RepID=A0ABT6Q301_9PROT|nr:exodeoxyribonuclease III [Commensalibacter sp. TBRC 16381]MDI2091487.1 exodeoxyribonuclease III [Commensalibacter sp. TBRC 16381]
MKLATWNVNSVRQRKELVQEWLKKEQPDWLFLQEIKCQTEQFPVQSFEDLGYQAVVHGQKAYNGVAILSRHPYQLHYTTLPDLDEKNPQARYIEIESENIILCNLYLPNGNSGGEEGFQRKIDFINALILRAKTLLEQRKNCIFAGDFNICPTDQDFAPETLSAEDALINPQSRRGFYQLLWAGLTDAVRSLYPTQHYYTFWDYTRGAWQRNAGLRIDHALLSPKIAEQLYKVTIDKKERSKEQPSDHVPLIIEF